jgi:hypothetical protein
LRRGEPLTSDGLRTALRQRLQYGAAQQPGPVPVNNKEKVAHRERMNDQLHALGYVR